MVSQTDNMTGFQNPNFYQRLNWRDWVWLVLLTISTIFIYSKYRGSMDGYEQIILFGSAISMVIMGWRWKALQGCFIAVAVISLLAISSYGGDIAKADTAFGLKYLFASQTAIMWMSALYGLAAVTYLLGLITANDFTERTASAMTWCATTMGLAGLMVRWYESYLIDPEWGHIPVSNLYEVFVLFCLITALLYLYYEKTIQTRRLGFFALMVINAAVIFLLWYSFEKNAHEIQPLVPALKSYWMKIHVPANFVGYGAFALAAMTSTAYLIKNWLTNNRPQSTLDQRLPKLELLDDVTYKAIALGFAFFTIATVLGAMWAAEAWGSYWSWDPKETWALIVWLNYAAWLHMRFTKGWQGSVMAWWSIVGLFITLFAFLGVNMFLSGLHSYGTL